MKLLVINGPNLNMLGIREPDIYGRQTYKDLEDYVNQICARKGIDCQVFQSNHEGDIVDKIQAAYGNTDGIVINPAAYTHTSVAILDALKAHLSDVNSRESFRHISYAGMACEKTYAGFGFEGYKMAIEYLEGKSNL